MPHECRYPPEVEARVRVAVGVHIHCFKVGIQHLRFRDYTLRHQY